LLVPYAAAAPTTDVATAGAAALTAAAIAAAIALNVNINPPLCFDFLAHRLNLPLRFDLIFLGMLYYTKDNYSKLLFRCLVLLQMR
jgi:predicted nicotinamide N-methyase